MLTVAGLYNSGSQQSPEGFPDARHQEILLEEGAMLTVAGL